MVKKQDLKKKLYEVKESLEGLKKQFKEEIKELGLAIEITNNKKNYSVKFSYNDKK